jgi:glycosyltransferase involved in cell wall biosynthesis
MSITDRKAKSADIALLLEGTFPYVRGGVSAWVYQMIHAFPQYRFAVVFIGGRREDYGKPQYELPPNVVHFEEHFIHEPRTTPSSPTRKADAASKQRVVQLHDQFRANTCPGALGRMLHDMLPMMRPGGALDEAQFLHGRHAWDFITERYDEHCTDPSFTDYFWTVRVMHRPLWQLAQIAEQLIPVKLYHTMSTGYAGLLGAMLRHRNNVPLVVSEHGVYTKERKIDLLQSQWIPDNRGLLERDISQLGYFQELWVRFFVALGRMCYDAADEIIALYEGNRERQIRDGAPEKKTRSIPNGISIARFAPLRSQRPARTPKVVALIGRVVPIKDIKTFIRSMFIAWRNDPEIKGWIVGPQDEDPAYAEECRDLLASLGMQSHIHFKGFQKIDELMPQIGLVALSSISEGLPLVILEALASGVPVVATDVGSCRQLIQGRSDIDRALGEAGAIVQIADADQFAHEVLSLLHDSQRWAAAQAAGIARVECYYADSLMKESYESVYANLLNYRRDRAMEGH